MSFDDTSAATSADGIDLLSLVPKSKSASTSGSGSRHLASAQSAHDDESKISFVEKELSEEVVAVFLGFLSHTDIMRKRVVCKTWRDAAKETVVPPDCCVTVEDVESYNTISVMSTALPNMQWLSIYTPPRFDGRPRLEFTDGEDPNRSRRAAMTIDDIQSDINILSNFSKLRILELDSLLLNGRYPALFNFPLLERLRIQECGSLKWDLKMLSGFPHLKELYCEGGLSPTGNLCDLRVLKNTLEKFEISRCDYDGIRGNFMDLADFPRLRKLELLTNTAVKGDIRDIGRDDFPAIEILILPDTVVGGCEFKFRRISEVPSFIEEIYPLLKRLIIGWEKWMERYVPSNQDWLWKLSKDSSDWYDFNDDAPFHVQFIRAGSRFGWTWRGAPRNDAYCEINWLDPEPSRDSSDYETYIEELQCIEQRIDFYKGCHEPPTQQEYWRRWHAQWE